MTTFNIGTQTAETVNNVGGDMVVAGAGWRPADVRAGLARFEGELDGLALPSETRAAVRRLVAEAGGADDPRRAAAGLERVARLLGGADAAARTGAGAIAGLRAAAVALGPAGKAAAAMLAALV